MYGQAVMQEKRCVHYSQVLERELQGGLNLKKRETEGGNAPAQALWIWC
jgi:hypothetical protein